MKEVITSIPDAPEQQSGENDKINHKKPWWRLPRWGIALGFFLGTFGLVAIVVVVARFYIATPPEDTKAAIPGILGVLTLVVIAIQVWVNQQQWKAMQESLEETRKLGDYNDQVIALMKAQSNDTALQTDAMQGQLDVMRETQKQAHRQVDLTREALVKLERPFVFVSSIIWRWRPNLDEEGKWIYTIHPMIQNVGNTPTKDLQMSIATDLRNTPIPDDFDFPFGTIPENLIIGPRGGVSGNAEGISGDDLLSVKKREKYFYIWGKLTYRDGFKGTRLHTTLFCNYIAFVFGDPMNPADEPPTKRVELGFAFYPIHNSAD